MIHYAARLRTAAPWIGLALLLALPPFAHAIDDPYLISIVTRGIILGIAVVGLDFILGYGALVSFGHAAFVGAGAYTVAILAHHAHEGTPLLGTGGTQQALIAWPLAVVVGAGLAGAIGALSLRTRGLYFIMITLAFGQMIYYLASSLERYGGDDGLILWERSRLPGIDVANALHFYYLCLALLVAVLFLLRRAIDARFGRVLRGAAENERRMRALGFPVYRYRLAAFTIAGAVGGLAGALLANQETFVSPELLSWQHSGEMLVMVILGGIGTLYGAALGGIVLVLLEAVLAAWTEHWMILLGPILVAVVLFARSGLWGALGRPAAGEAPDDG